jgi:hypothetical protein
MLDQRLTGNEQPANLILQTNHIDNKSKLSKATPKANSVHLVIPQAV